MKTRLKILVAAGSAYGDSVAARLRGDGHAVDLSRSCEEALNLAREAQYSAFVIGYELPEAEYREMIAEIRRKQPDASVIVTAHGPNLEEGAFAALAQRALESATNGVMTLEAMEKALIRETLEKTGGRIKEAAAIIGVDRSTIYEKIKKYEIPRTKRRS
ncbi:MAG TPA: helix-turn-helix domain-containing protein [Bryobacteraceae bacterium]|nr:helix-turn-helix domain-containing protein [Bryobacteraceae bacterium]